MVMPSPLIESSKKAKPLLQTSIEAHIQVDSIIKEKVMTKDGKFLIYINKHTYNFVSIIIIHLLVQIFIFGNIHTFLFSYN